MTDLATRIEQATGPDRELFLEAFYETHGSALQGNIALPYQEYAAAFGRFIELIDAEAYLDAAMSLVPEGRPSKQIGTTDDGVGYAALAGNDMHMMAEDPDEFWVEATAATPALALCAAALRAREARP